MSVAALAERTREAFAPIVRAREKTAAGLAERRERLRHVVLDEPFPWGFLEAAKGIQLAELGMQSWRERRFVEVPELTL